MSREMDDFCAEHGIQRQHSVRARPQQNGVSECANRTMEQAIISMLHQAGLPLSFWGKALSAFIHVWNRTPTSAVPGKTPWETFYGTKPDVSMMRVWGCVANVHIQKDKREWGSLGSHMEKCIFIGYPPDYKGWKFYNPITKKSVVSECAQFDERYFLGIKESTPTIMPTVIPSSLLEHPPPSPIMVCNPYLFLSTSFPLVTQIGILVTLGMCMVMGEVVMGLPIHIPLLLPLLRGLGLKAIHSGSSLSLLNLLHLPDKIWPLFLPLTMRPLPLLMLLQGPLCL